MNYFKIFFDNIDDIYNKIMKSINKISVPFFNLIFDYYVDSFPSSFNKLLEKSIDKGLCYFKMQKEISFDAAATFTIMINKSFESRLVWFDDKINDYANKWNDPHLRLLDETYDPETSSPSSTKPTNIDELSEVEKPLLKCLYAEKIGLDIDFLRELKQIDDNGGYGTTHLLLSCIILKKFSSLPRDMLDAMIESTVAPMVAAQRHSCAGDLFSERTVLMQWLGYDSVIRPAWIVRIIRAQMRDGGWYWRRSLGKKKSHQHPSCLGLAALIQYRTKRMEWQSRVHEPKPSELGRAFPLAGC